MRMPLFNDFAKTSGHTFQLDRLQGEQPVPWPVLFHRRVDTLVNSVNTCDCRPENVSQSAVSKSVNVECT
jgi:hypothetical protein